MTRAEAVVVVGAWLDAFLTEAEIAAEDTTTNLKEPLDAALAALGVASVDRATAAPADGDLFVRYSLYFTLRRVLVRLASNFNVTLGSNTFALNQLFTNAKTFYDELAKELGELPWFGMAAWSSVVDLGFTTTIAAGDEFAG